MKDQYPLPVSTPEAEGLSSAAIWKLVDTLDHNGVCMHSFSILKNEKLVAEGYWKPFAEDTMHRLYSCTKSVTSLAIGVLVGDGLVKLDQKIADFFPNDIPENPHPWVMETTVEDCLRMATPYTDATYCHGWPKPPIQSGWVRSFFEGKPSHPPGTLFHYDTCASTLLAAVVEIVSGKRFTDFLWERITGPIGCSEDIRCIETPDGYQWGGSGLLCTTRDFAKLALLTKRLGNWNGKHLIPADYLRKATTKQIDASYNSVSASHSNDYGYQIWIHDRGFSFLGMGGQFAFVYPEEDLIFVCTADTQGDSKGYSMPFALCEQILLPAVSTGPLSEAPGALARLQEKLASLSLALCGGAVTTPVAAEISGVSYKLEPNPMGITTLSVSLNGDEGTLTYENDTGHHTLGFGFGHHWFGAFPEVGYYKDRIHNPGPAYPCAVCAGWTEAAKLCLHVRVMGDFYGTAKFQLVFRGDRLVVEMTKTAEWFLNNYQGIAVGTRMKDGSV